MALNKEEQFLESINKHKGIIHKISRMYMDTAENREDLSQEIILQLWKSYQSFRNDSQFSTWMYRVAVNTAITFFKKEQRNKAFSVLDERNEVIPDADHIAKEEKLQSFYKAVHSLNNIEKALIFLYLEGQSHREIGDKLGISEVNARVKLSRTKDKLQAIIKQQLE
jgi:RNA polymerase sigma-70 factor (ECF subfamily)